MEINSVYKHVNLRIIFTFDRDGRLREEEEEEREEEERWQLFVIGLEFHQFIERFLIGFANFLNK